MLSKVNMVLRTIKMAFSRCWTVLHCWIYLTIFQHTQKEVLFLRPGRVHMPSKFFVIKYTRKWKLLQFLTYMHWAHFFFLTWWQLNISCNMRWWFIFHFHFITYMTFTLIVTGTGGCLLLFISLQSGMCLPCFFHYCLLLFFSVSGHVFYIDFSYMLHPFMCMQFSMLSPCLLHALLYIS